MHNVIKYLEDIKHNLKNVDYNNIYNVLSDLKSFAIPVAKLFKDSYIDRVRINELDESSKIKEFNKEDDITYIKNIEKLKNRKDFGRANKPKQAMFYGSVESTAIGMPRATAYFETSSLLKNKEFTEISEIFTLSRWRVKEDIDVLEVIFSKAALAVNEDIRKAFEFQAQNLSKISTKENNLENVKEALTFFSDEFAKVDINTSDDYKISCAYSNFILNHFPNLGGITYPSVQSNYLGQNIALKPETVNNFLELEHVAMFKCEGDINGSKVYGIKDVVDLGENNDNFKWIDKPTKSNES